MRAWFNLWADFQMAGMYDLLAKVGPVVDRPKYALMAGVYRRLLATTFME